MASPAGNYKNFNYRALSTSEVDAIDSSMPVSGNPFSRKIDDALEFQKVRVVLTAAQLRTLNATPVQVIAAPGAGLAIVISQIVAKMTYGSYAYNSVGSGDDLAFKYTNSSGAILCQLETVGFLDQSSNQVRVGFPNSGSAASVNLTPVENAPIVAHILTGEIASSNVAASGDSPVVLDIYYRTIAV